MLLACLCKKWQIRKGFTSDARMPPYPHRPFSPNFNMKASQKGSMAWWCTYSIQQNFLRREFQVKETSSFLCYLSRRWKLRLGNQTHKRSFGSGRYARPAPGSEGVGERRKWASSWLWSSLWSQLRLLCHLGRFNKRKACWNSGLVSLCCISQEINTVRL